MSVTFETERERQLFRLAESLRAELLYVQETGDIRDSVRNSQAVLADAESLLGAADSEGE